MKYQLAIIVFTLLAFVLANRASGTGLVFALTAPLIQRNPAQNLYEVAKLVFEKGIEDLEKALDTGLEKLKGDVDGMFQKANEQTKSSVDGVEKALKTEIENAVNKVNELEKKSGKLDPEVQKQLDAIQIELKKSGNHQQAHKSFADLFRADFEKKAQDAKGVKDSMTGRMDMEIDTKAVVMESGSFTGTGDVIAPDRRPGIIVAPTRKVHMRDLLFRGTTTSSNNWDYTVESGYNDGTATVAEGAVIPKTDLTMEQKRIGMTKIAASMDISTEIMEDIPGLLSYIQGRLKTKYDYKEDNQLLFGSGTGTDIKGVYTAATAFAAGGVKPTNSANFWDVLAVAATQLAINEYMGTAAVVSIQDFANMALTKDTQGRYILPIMLQGNMGQQVVFGLNVLPTTAMPQNSWLVGDFENSAEIVDRRLVNILFSNENKDNFDRDLMTIKLTARLGLPIYYTGGFVKGTFTGTGGGVLAVS